MFVDGMLGSDIQTLSSEELLFPHLFFLTFLNSLNHVLGSTRGTFYFWRYFVHDFFSFSLVFAYQTVKTLFQQYFFFLINGLNYRAARGE